MVKKFLYLLGLVLLVLFCYQVFDYFSFVKKQNETVYEKGISTSEELRDQVDGILSKIAKEGERLATEFGNNNYTKKEIEEMIKASSLSIPEIQGVTACYEPYAFSKDRELFCPYYNKGGQDYMYVGESYNYSVKGEGTAWYTGVRDEGAKWVEPYYAKAAKDWYIDYGIPFYYKSGPNKGKVRGTITMSFVAGGFKKMVHGLSLGKTGYGLITSTKGMLLAHPVNEYIGTTNLKKLIEKETHEQLRASFHGILDGKKGTSEFYDEEAKDQTIFIYDQIPTSGWGMGVMFYKNDMLGNKEALNHRYINMALIFSFLLIILIAIYFNKDYLDEREIWLLSVLGSVLLIANIFLVGYLEHFSNPPLSENESLPIVDVNSLRSFVAQQHQKSDTLKRPRAVNIPTGIFVQRMEFEDSYNLNVGGTIWQKYPEFIADSVEIGFTLPQMSPFSEAAYVEETYRKRVSGKEDEAAYLLVGWEFRVTLRLNLKYGNYPFDKRHISIDILPLDNNDHLIFTPDLASYNYTNPSRKSGLNPDIEMSGSEVLESYFNYSLVTYDTDFGYGEKALFEEMPILHYNINVRRVLLNAFVTYLIPIFVTLAMMFILLFSCGKTDERQGIIESMAAFFFVLIFSHIDLRKEIITADLIYMEYFYFIAYFMIILTTFNLITYSKDKSMFFDFNNNQVFKAIYFPLFFILLLGVSLWKFY